MKIIVRVKAPNGRIIPIFEDQLEEYIKRGCVEITDEQLLNSSKIKPPEIPKEESLICPICGYVGKNAKAIRMHKLAKHKVK